MIDGNEKTAFQLQLTQVESREWVINWEPLHECWSGSCKASVHALTKSCLNCVEKVRMCICNGNLFASPGLDISLSGHVGGFLLTWLKFDPISSSLIPLTVWSHCILFSLSLYYTLLGRCKLTAFLKHISAALMCQKAAVKVDEVHDPKSQGAGFSPAVLPFSCSPCTG